MEKQGLIEVITQGMEKQGLIQVLTRNREAGVNTSYNTEWISKG